MTTPGTPPSASPATRTLAPTSRTWYHGSPACLQPGDLLQPQEHRNFPQSRPGVVSLTTDPETALHWAREAAKIQGADHTHVYQVQPLGPLTPWRVRDADLGTTVVYDEVHAREAHVIRMAFGHDTDELPPPEIAGFNRDPHTGYFVKADALHDTARR